MLGEQAAAHERDTHRAEVVAAHDADVGDRLLALRRRGPIRHTEPRRRAQAVERQEADAAGRDDAGHVGQVPNQLLEEAHPRRVLAVGRARQRDLHRQYLVRAEPRIDRQQALEAADEQAGAREQDDGQRDLDDHQRRAQAAAPRAAAAHAVLQRVVEIGPRRRHRRCEAEEHGRGERDEHREGQDPAVERRRLEPWNGELLGGRREQRLKTPGRDEHAAGRAGPRERDALDEQLPHEPETAGAERRPHRQLALPRRRARQEQVGDVGAGDEQHEADRAGQRAERRPHGADQLFPKRHHVRGPAGIAIGELGRQTRREAIHVGPRLREIDAGRQAGHRNQPSPPGLACCVAEAGREPHVDLAIEQIE